MASHGKLHTLCGFSEELNWRPTHFVEPIPAHRICNVCGLVPRMTAFLPCRHVLCQTCYDQCLVNDGHACPLEGEPFLEEDADWRDFPMENLLKRKVKCWNKDNGCDVVVTASDVHKHFYKDCVHHSTRCPKCSAFVLCSNLCGHRRSDCSMYAEPSMAANRKPCNDSVQEAIFTALETILEERVGEIRSALKHIVRESGAQCDRINELAHTINALRETIIQSLEKRARPTDDNVPSNEYRTATVKDVNEGLIAQGDKLSQRMSSLTEELKLVVVDATRQCLEKMEQNPELTQPFITNGDLLNKVFYTVSTFEDTLGKALERATETNCQKCALNATESIPAIKSAETERVQSTPDVKRDLLLGHNTLNLKSYEFFLKGLQSLKEKAKSEGFANYYEDPIYLCGYRISPGVRLVKNEGFMSARWLIKLHKGVIDEFLQWPFNVVVKLTFIGYSKGTNRELSEQTSKCVKNYIRPTESSNAGCYSTQGCNIEDLEQEGYK